MLEFEIHKLDSQVGEMDVKKEEWGQAGTHRHSQGPVKMDWNTCQF